ncbi:MAG: GNAT family N-acetyltransferase [Alphaproteobacteria bacterium]
MKESITITIANNKKDINASNKLRKQIFVTQQKIPEESEFDGNDFGATIIIAKFENQVIGSMRIRYFGEFVKFERMVVAPNFQSKNIPKQILEYASTFCAKKGFKKIMSACSPRLIPYWKRQGFKVTATQQSFLLNDKELVPVEKEISCPNPININTPHQVLCLKEIDLIKENNLTNKLHVITTFINKKTNCS